MYILQASYEKDYEILYPYTCKVDGKEFEEAINEAFLTRDRLSAIYGDTLTVSIYKEGTDEPLWDSGAKNGLFDDCK